MTHKIIGHKLLTTGITLAVASGLVTVALLTGAGNSASAATAGPSTTASTMSSSSATKSVDPEVAKFRADLKAARALTDKARIDAIKKVRTDAKAGKYGDKVERRVSHHGARLWAHAPKELKTDLKAARMTAPADRTAKLHEVFAKALAGDYGSGMQKRAERLRSIVDGK